MLETFRDVNEIVAAIARVKSICALPIVAQMTIEGRRQQLDGTRPEQFVPALQAAGAGCHRHQLQHWAGAHARDARAAWPAHIGACSAQPNAGRRAISKAARCISRHRNTWPPTHGDLTRRARTPGRRAAAARRPSTSRQIKAATPCGYALKTSAVRATAPAPAAPVVTPVCAREKSYLANALARA
jgi:hypothetical protein